MPVVVVAVVSKSSKSSIAFKRSVDAAAEASTRPFFSSDRAVESTAAAVADPPAESPRASFALTLIIFSSTLSLTTKVEDSARPSLALSADASNELRHDGRRERRVKNEEVRCRSQCQSSAVRYKRKNQYSRRRARTEFLAPLLISRETALQSLREFSKRISKTVENLSRIPTEFKLFDDLYTNGNSLNFFGGTN